MSFLSAIRIFSTSKMLHVLFQVPISEDMLEDARKRWKSGGKDIGPDAYEQIVKSRQVRYISFCCGISFAIFKICSIS